MFGAGKVGKALHRALRVAGQPVQLRSWRSWRSSRAQVGPWPERGTVLLALRDGELAAAAQAWAREALARPEGNLVALHCAGSLDAEVLAPLRARGIAVGQLHPLLSFASGESPPSLQGAYVHVGGDPRAEREARRIARLLGLRPPPRGTRSERRDRALYHAAAALCANGAAALVAAASDLLVAAGFERARTGTMLGPLLRSVALNVEALGPEKALTGPVRRGDVEGVRRGLAALGEASPVLLPLARELARAQLPVARTLGEASPEAFEALEALLSPRGASPREGGQP